VHTVAEHVRRRLAQVVHAGGAVDRGAEQALLLVARSAVGRGTHDTQLDLAGAAALAPASARAGRRRGSRAQQTSSRLVAAHHRRAGRRGNQAVGRRHDHSVAVGLADNLEEISLKHLLFRTRLGTAYMRLAVHVVHFVLLVAQVAGERRAEAGALRVAQVVTCVVVGAVAVDPLGVTGGGRHALRPDHLEALLTPETRVVLRDALIV